MSALKTGIRFWLAALVIFSLCIILGFNLFAPDEPSAEWIYTIDIINKFVLPSLLGLLAVLLIFSLLSKRSLLASKSAAVLLAIAACVFTAIPLLSPSVYRLSWQMQYLLSFCWAFALLCGGLLAFIIATRLSPIWSMVSCTIGSFFLAFCAMESYLLFSDQPADGLQNASSDSRYVKQGAAPDSAGWAGFECGTRYAVRPFPFDVGHRLDKAGKQIFDVKYSLDSKGWRRLPERSSNAVYDLMIFGCSYTFGHSLEDEQTWPWLLANRLGKDWKVEDYAMIGWGANQMLCLLEHNLIEFPKGRQRYALFLAIRDHLRRTDFFPGTPVYHIDENGEAVSGGRPRYNSLHSFPETINGSQLAREAAGWTVNIIMKHPTRMLGLYLAMLQKSALILKQKYDTKLIVLLWPDLENLEGDFKRAGLTTISMKAMFPGWDKDASQYFISPYDGHPNEKAAQAIANWLGSYFQKIVLQAQTADLEAK